MPTRKISDIHGSALIQPPCQDPDHNVPNMQVFTPGVYEHECPRCGQKTVFRAGFSDAILSGPRR